MTTSSDIIQTLTGKTKTLGYDAVVAYDRDKINHLLEQQYVSKRADGTHLPPVSWSNSKGTVRFSDLTLAAPLISFENATIVDSRVSVTMEFIRGSIAEIDSNSQVTRYTRIRPGSGFFLKLDVDLKKGSGSVDEKGHVLLALAAGSVNTTNVTDDPAEEIIPYFEQWLKQNPVTYSLGQLDLGAAGSNLIPTDFIIRTQPAPDAGKVAGHGAVLLFILTTSHPQENHTSLPDESYPWLIPDEHSSAILLNSRLVMGQFVKPAMDKILDTGEWVMQRGGSADDAAWSLVTSDNATLRRDYIRLIGEGDDSSTAWSGHYKDEFGDMYGEVHEDMIFNLRGARLETEGDSLSLDFSPCPERTTQFASAIWHCGGNICAYNYKKAALSFRLSGQGTNPIKVNAESEIIQIQPNVGNLSIINNFDQELGHFIDYVGQRSQMSGQMESQLDNALTATILGSIGSVNFESISVFAVDHILFPEQNINQLKSAGMPGDMIVFGDISPALTSLSVTPLNTTVAAGKTVQFIADGDVTWSVSPAEAGTISASGLYRAPENIHGILQSVKITATGRNKGAASAYVAVVPSSVMISPAFAAIKEVADTPLSLQFSATLADGASLSGWSASPEESGGPTGTIDSNGLYTTPKAPLPKGYSWIAVNAMASDGTIASARVLLISRTTHAEFPVTPPLLTEMPLESGQLFSATGDGEIDPEVWALHPQEGSGTLSDLKVTGNEEEPKYTVTYTAPESVTGDKLVIITTMAEDMPLRSGYALVDLASEKANPWSLVEGVSTLRVTSEIGSGEAELYKNGVNQAAVNIQFTGFRTDSETGKPEYISVGLDDILPHMKLVDYVTGEELPRSGTAGWTYTVQENSYKRLPVSGGANQVNEDIAQNVNTYALYVSCYKDEQSSAKRIAVSVELKDGTVISTANGASSGFDSSLTINGRPGITYSVNEGVSVTAPSAPVTKMKVGWASLEVAAGCYTDRDDQCEIRIDKFIISPNVTGITEFRTGKFSDGVIDDISVSNIQTMWKDKQEFVFDCLSGSGRQCAVMGVTTKDVQEGSANIWFTGPTAVLNKGQIYFSDENKDVIYRVSIPEFSDTEGQDQTCITLLKVKTPIAVKPYRWTSVDLEPDLVITDDYGNSGRLHFKWDESGYYEKPHIS